MHSDCQQGEEAEFANSDPSSHLEATETSVGDNYPEYVIVCQLKTSSMLGVEVHIDGKPLKAVVDTAAEVTILSDLEGEVSGGEIDFIKTENVDELSYQIQTKQAPTVPSITRKRAQVRKPPPKDFRSNESPANTAVPQRARDEVAVTRPFDKSLR